MRVLVTRPQDQAGPWVERLRQAGVDAAALPLIGIAPMADARPLQAAWAGLAAHRLVVFVSPNAVQFAFAERPAGHAWPASTLAGAPGPGTAKALRGAGVPADRLVAPPDEAPRHDSEALWQELQPHGPWGGHSALIVRGLSEEPASAEASPGRKDVDAQGDPATATGPALEAVGRAAAEERERSGSGREWLAETLRAAGMQVHFVVAYRRGVPSLDTAQRSLWQAAWTRPQQHLWLLSSSEALDHLRTLGAPDLAASQALATHPRIAQRAREAGFGRVLEGGGSVASVLACLDRVGRSIESSAP